MEKDLKELVHELDESFSSILLNKDTIESIKNELGRIRDDMDNTNQKNVIASMAICFMEIYHKICLLDDLLRYVSNDLNDNYKQGNKVKNEIFHQVMSDKESES